MGGARIGSTLSWGLHLLLLLLLHMELLSMPCIMQPTVPLQAACTAACSCRLLVDLRW